MQWPEAAPSPVPEGSAVVDPVDDGDVTSEGGVSCTCDSDIPPGGFHEGDCPMNPNNQGDDRMPDDSGEKPHRIPRHRYHELCRELAERVIKRTALAKKYGVKPQSITEFAKRHAYEIDEIKKHLDDEFAGIWIASKGNRLAALGHDYDRTLEHPRAYHHEWVKARIQIAHAVAEELGQLPNRSQLTIGGVVRHELVGVDIDECLPADEQPGS